MYYRCRRKPKYTFSTETKQRKAKTGFFAITIVLLLVMAAISLFLRDLSTKIAVSDAVDIVTKTVNDSINKVIGEGVYGFDYFVSLVKDEIGNITAITSNMAHINTLSTEILNSVIESTENGTIKVKIPAGNLTGLNLLVGKGPDVTVDIVMLTSSKVDFKNDIVSSGINQAKYQLMLEVTIDIDVLVPWGTKSASTVTEVIVADTVIVGKVPETYLNMEK
jgi:sporulation protein YunB